MPQTIVKWGNSLGLRIPQSIAEQIKLSEGSQVVLEVVDGNLVIKPKRTKYSLDALLADITQENLHGETDTGASHFCKSTRVGQD
jgi:antitoxin MazE